MANCSKCGKEHELTRMEMISVSWECECGEHNGKKAAKFMQSLKPGTYFSRQWQL